MEKTVNVIICGIAGRMGKSIASAAIEDDRYALLSGTVNPKSQLAQQRLTQFLGKDAPSVVAASSLRQACINLGDFPKRTVVIDFSAPKSVAGNVETAKKNGLPYLLGCTGLSASQLANVESAATEIPVLIAPNVSLGANLLAYLAEISARAFHSADVEMLDIHHKGKKDAPSGTAIDLAGRIAKARNHELVVTHRNSNDRPRVPGEIGIASLRGGAEKGEHRVFFFGENERLELSHQVSDRAIFAQGALTGAKYLASCKPGLYNMMNVLGIR